MRSRNSNRNDPTDNIPTENTPDLQGGRLTALSVQKGNPDRLNLFIDDTFRLGVYREVVIRHGLIKKGMEVSTEQLLALWRDEQSYKARDLAARYLTARARSAKQVADYLAGKEFDEVVVRETVEWLEGQGYLNDTLYAKEFTSQRMRSRPRGKRMLRWELQQKGISADDIEAALAERVDRDAEVDAALRLLQKKAWKRIGTEPAHLSYEERAKLYQFLARKGFSGGVITEALGLFGTAANLDND